MNGVHDLGGMHGFGPVRPEVNEPIFHADWHRQVLGLNLAAGGVGGWNIDRSRHFRESLAPAVYLSSSYYEIWLRGLERLVVAHGLADPDELEAGRSLRPPTVSKAATKAEDVTKVLRAGRRCDRPMATPASFSVGQSVRAKNQHVAGHTRLPRYIRGHIGTIERVLGGFVYPDTNAHLQGEHPQWCYTVRFTGPELWGPDADPTTTMSVDCFESYLDLLPD